MFIQSIRIRIVIVIFFVIIIWVTVPNEFVRGLITAFFVAFAFRREIRRVLYVPPTGDILIDKLESEYDRRREFILERGTDESADEGYLRRVNEDKRWINLSSSSPHVTASYGYAIAHSNEASLRDPETLECLRAAIEAAKLGNEVPGQELVRELRLWR